MANRIDCSITENYLKEKARALRPSADAGLACTINCADCPINTMHCGTDELLNPADAISRIQAWSDAHPRKTYKDDFFAGLPNARKDEEGYPFVEACDIYDDDTMADLCGGRPCHECWDLPMEEL